MVKDEYFSQACQWNLLFKMSFTSEYLTWKVQAPCTLECVSICKYPADRQVFDAYLV